MSGMNLRTKAVLYRQISVMLTAGLPMDRVLEHISSTGSGPAVRQAAAVIWRRVRQGEQFARAAGEAFGRHLSTFEQAVLTAGERSGTLPESCRRLADYFDFVHSSRSRLISGLFYPAVILHAAIVIPAVPLLILRGPGQFLGRVVPPFVFIYGCAAAVLLFRKSTALRRVGRVFDGLVLDIPVVGSFVRALDLSRFLYALSSLYAAGLPIVEAFRLSADTAGNAIVRERLHAVEPALRKGLSLGEALKDCRILPPVVYDMFVTGEVSGRLDETLERAAGYLQQEVETTTQRVVAVMPTVVYLMVAVYVAIIVISFWSGYFGQINSLLGD